MLLSENLISYLSVHIKAQNTYGTSSFRCNSSQKLVHNTAQKLKNEDWRIMAYFFIILLAFAQVIFGAANVPLVIGLENFFFILAASTVCFLKWTAFKRNNNLIELFNLFAYFETRNSEDIIN